MRLIGSTFFGFAQNTKHDFQNTALNSTNATYVSETKANRKGFINLKHLVKSITKFIKLNRSR